MLSHGVPAQYRSRRGCPEGDGIVAQGRSNVPAGGDVAQRRCEARYAWVMAATQQ
jgi:hypothetical protein